MKVFRPDKLFETSFYGFYHLVFKSLFLNSRYFLQIQCCKQLRLFPHTCASSSGPLIWFEEVFLVTGSSPALPTQVADSKGEGDKLC